MIKPLFNAQDDEWVVMVGRYMLNLGAIEMATRLLITRIEGTDDSPIVHKDLVARIGFVRTKFPRENKERHKWAMNALAMASKHAGFRNIVAHSPLAISEQPDGTYQIHGILNVTPKGDVSAELVSLEEITGRVNESAVVARQLLEMQSDFPAAGDGKAHTNNWGVEGPSASSKPRGDSPRTQASCGHAFPFESRGMAEGDRSTHVWVGFNIPASLYLDSSDVGGLLLRVGDTRLDFKHIVNPLGRCGMPVQMTGAEIIDDDRGKYTYTSVSACIPVRPHWKAGDYVSEAIRATNEVIVAFREAANRRTIATIGPTDLSQGLAIEGPFPDPKEFMDHSGISGLYVAGPRADGTAMLHAKGFAAGYGPLKSTYGADFFGKIQQYLSGAKRTSVARRFLQEAFRELRHGDFAFASVLGGSSLDIGIQELLDRKSWQSGKAGTFANKYLVDPFLQNGQTGFDQVEPKSFLLVERLYKVRNKVVHEGKPYYTDDSATPPRSVVVTSTDVDEMLQAADIALAWIETHP